MATIALTRCITLVTKQGSKLNRFFTVKVTMTTCAVLWIIVFAMLAPTTFGVAGFGSFQYIVGHGKCEVFNCEDQDGRNLSGWVYLVASTVPCFFIITSYIGISVFIYLKAKRLSIPQVKSQESRVNQTLLILCASYLAFTIPLIPVEFGILKVNMDPERAAFWSQVIMAWYWWIFGVNFFIYVASTPVFRTIYRVFLGEVATKLGATGLATRILPETEEGSWTIKTMSR